MRHKKPAVLGQVAGDDEFEPSAGELKFTIYKYTPRQKPSDPRNVVIFPCFSEFGTEVLGSLYCIPQLLANRHQGKYSIVIGWAGRGYLYRHLVDEYWELHPEFQWLRQYCRAFHHVSRNLHRFETKLAKEGQVANAMDLGKVAVYPKLDNCLRPECKGQLQVSFDGQRCRACGGLYPPVGIFNDPVAAKQYAVWPQVSAEKKALAATYLKGPSVGIIARNRATYGRNLPPIFYERLIHLLEDMGYFPVWLGEKTSIHPCPYSRVFDFSSTPESLDLEMTLALVSELKFTIQFWTASTRLAGLAGAPFVLFESPDQVWGDGHEGLRLHLCTRGRMKLVGVHYKDIAENHDLGLSLARRAVRELEVNDDAAIVAAQYWKEVERG